MNQGLVDQQTGLSNRLHEEEKNRDRLEKHIEWLEKRIEWLEKNVRRIK